MRLCFVSRQSHNTSPRISSTPRALPGAVERIQGATLLGVRVRGRGGQEGVGRGRGRPGEGKEKAGRSNSFMRAIRVPGRHQGEPADDCGHGVQLQAHVQGKRLRNPFSKTTLAEYSATCVIDQQAS